MICGSTYEQERQEEKFDGLMDYVFSCQIYNDSDFDSYGKSTLFEEAFHMYHQNGLATVWPTVFGYNPNDPWNDYDYSLVCRETASHQCVSPGWWHGENDCPIGAPFSPGNPAKSPPSGTCNYPSCDCNEFFRQAYTKYVDWGNNGLWYSEYFPENRETFMNMISPDFKNMLSDPQYSLSQSPPPDAYLVTDVIGTCTDSYECSPTSSPTKSPSSSPVETPVTSAPVASPVSNENSCFDFPDKIKWRIKGVISTLYCSGRVSLQKEKRQVSLSKQVWNYFYMVQERCKRSS